MLMPFGTPTLTILHLVPPLPLPARRALEPSIHRPPPPSRLAAREQAAARTSRQPAEADADGGALPSPHDAAAAASRALARARARAPPRGPPRGAGRRRVRPRVRRRRLCAAGQLLLLPRRERGALRVRPVLQLLRILHQVRVRASAAARPRIRLVPAPSARLPP